MEKCDYCGKNKKHVSPMLSNSYRICSDCSDRPIDQLETMKQKEERERLSNKFSQKQTPQTRDEAIQYAIDWQNWQSKRSLSYRELAEWSAIFTELGERFNLTEEFKENGII